MQKNIDLISVVIMNKNWLKKSELIWREMACFLAILSALKNNIRIRIYSSYIVFQSVIFELTYS